MRTRVVSPESTVAGRPPTVTGVLVPSRPLPPTSSAVPGTAADTSSWSRPANPVDAAASPEDELRDEDDSRPAPHRQIDTTLGHAAVKPRC
jgi:hypothetical protein